MFKPPVCGAALAGGGDVVLVLVDDGAVRVGVGVEVLLVVDVLAEARGDGGVVLGGLLRANWLPGVLFALLFGVAADANAV